MTQSHLDQSQLERFRRRLERDRDRFQRDADSLAEQQVNTEGRSEATDAGSHQADQGTEAFEDTLAVSLNTEARERVDEIGQALERMDAGAYGICEDCGGPIDPDRLDSRPWASRCMDCQRKFEASAGSARAA